MYYETGELNEKQKHNFLTRFDSEIGTEREVNSTYILCCELTREEVKLCRKIEQGVTK